MQAQRIAIGEYIDHTPVADLQVGEVVVVGDNLIGITERPIVANELGALATEGVFDFVKDSSDVSEGDSLYWDANGNPVGGTAGSGASTLTATGNKYLGAALADAGVAAETVNVLKTKQPAITVNNAIENAIADPGDAGAIPIPASGHVPIVTAGAETRSLADPTFTGQRMLLCMKTDGGDAVVTAASAVNQAGNNTLTFADAGDAVELVAIESGANKVWRTALNDGVSLTTV